LIIEGDYIMADLAKLKDELSKLTVMEAAELSKMLEEEWGVSAAAPVAAAAGGDAGGETAKDSYNVMLNEVGGTKIAVIKEVRAITGLGLKEAKAIVDSAPAAVKEGVPTAEAEEIKAKLEAAGATVELV
jgi:large subunit ribosomal protein L7/L12